VYKSIGSGREKSPVYKNEGKNAGISMISYTDGKEEQRVVWGKRVAKAF